MTRVSRQIFWGTVGTLAAIFPAILWAHVEGPDARHSVAREMRSFLARTLGSAIRRCKTAVP